MCLFFIEKNMDKKILKNVLNKDGFYLRRILSVL